MAQPASGRRDAVVSIPERPANVIWDVTYACPLRCTHCYSESGRRAAKQLGHDDMLRVADAIIALRPDGVALAGGEPLLVPNIFEIAERFSRAELPVVIYTGGWLPLTPEKAEAMPRAFSQVTVSVDGATPEVNDRIRGRVGAFERAMDTLSRLDDMCRNLPARWRTSVRGLRRASRRCGSSRSEPRCRPGWPAASVSSTASYPPTSSRSCWVESNTQSISNRSRRRRCR
jgi:sulfatase maturation enzyme AslB (radical SAM superfamily)